MSETASVLTVYFEGPFWVGVFERMENGRLTATKVTFGGEPRDFEIYEFILRRYGELKFSPAIAAAGKESGPQNPKRVRREARKRLESAGVGTKAQQALKLQREQSKTERKRRTREEKQAEARLRFEQKQQKKKEKHRGR